MHKSDYSFLLPKEKNNRTSSPMKMNKAKMLETKSTLAKGQKQERYLCHNNHHDALIHQ